MTVNALVGIPWLRGGDSVEGADCWGLTRIAMRELYGVHLDPFEGELPRGRDLANAIMSATDTDTWARVDTILEGDVVTMSVKKYPHHVGVCVGGGMVLHTLEAAGSGASVVMSLRDIQKVHREVVGYRHVSTP